MGLFAHVDLWDDVLDQGMDEALAPEFDQVLDGSRYRMYSDPREFFARTFVSESMLDVVEGVAEALRGGGRHVYVLYSFFGGGKTHTLMTIYHAFRDPRAFYEAAVASAELLPVGERSRLLERAERARRLLAGVSPRVIVFHGKISRLFPVPGFEPVHVGGIVVKTLWGLLGAELGRYGIVKRYDEAAKPPEIDVIRRLLEGLEVVMLIDELAEGLAGLLRSGRAEDRDYAMQVISFIDNLLSAASGSRAAVVLALPTERSGGEWRWESRYKGLEDVLETLVRAIGRVNAALIEPVPSAEFWRILQRRLFRRIDRRAAARVATELRNVYSEYNEVFGAGAARIAEKVGETYPFHPGFVEVLRLILERNPRLQKTRDALRLSRIIARMLYKESRKGRLPVELIMAWHIDPTVEELSTILQGFDRYKLVVDTDLVSNIKKLGGLAELGKLVAVSVFDSTFVYESFLSKTVFPDKQRVALMVYEPGIFQARGWLPTDIPQVLDELEGSLYYLWSDGERYWFWDIPNIVKLVEERAEQLVMEQRPRLLWELTNSEEYLKGLVSRKLSIRGRRGGLGESYHPRLFEEKRVQVEADPEQVPDNDKYKLVITWRPPKEGFERLVTHTIKAGKPTSRVYANTVVVLAPGRKGLEEEAVHHYARVRAADEVWAQLDEMLREYAGRLDVDVRDAVRRLQSALLRRVRDRAVNDLLVALLNGFDTIYYPASGGVQQVSAARLGVTALCLAEKAEEVLVREGKAILAGPFSFDYLVTLLQGGLERRRTVKEIVDEFRISPALPMVPEQLVLEALLEGYRQGRLVIVKPDGSVFFARLQKGPCSSVQAAPVTPRLEHSDYVVLAGSNEGMNALLEYLEDLVGDEERSDGSIVVRSVVAEIEGAMMSLNEFKELVEGEPGLVENTRFCIVEEVRKPGVKLEAAQQRLQLVEGQEAVVAVRIRRVGEVSPGKVTLTVEAGEGVEARIEPASIDEEGEAKLRLRVLRPGTYTVAVRATPERGGQDQVDITIVVEGREAEVPCNEAQEGLVRAVFLRGPWSDIEFSLEDLSRAYPDTRMKLRLWGGGILFEVEKGIRAEDAVEAAKKIVELMRDIAGSRAEAEVEIVFGEAVGVADVAIFLESLGSRAECRMRVLR